MIALYRSISVYKPNSTKVKTGTKARIRVQEMTDREIEILLPLVKTLRTSLTSLSLLLEEKLQQVQSLTIWTGLVDFASDFYFSKQAG